MTTTTLPLDGERLFQIARDTGLRHHLHGVAPAGARALLMQFITAVYAAQRAAAQAPADGLVTLSACPDEYLDGVRAPFVVQREDDPIAYVFDLSDGERIVAAFNDVNADAPKAHQLDAIDGAIAVRDQALLRLMPDVLLALRNGYLNDSLIDDLELALKGTAAAAVATDKREVSVLSVALALLVTGGFVTEEKVDEAIQIARDTPGVTRLPANDPQSSGHPGPLAAVEPSDTARLNWLETHFAEVRGAYLSGASIVPFAIDCGEDCIADGVKNRIRTAVDAAIAASKERAAF